MSEEVWKEQAIQLMALLDAEKRKTQWQPIETAPKDDMILGWDGFEVESLENFNGDWGQVSDSGRITVSYPTHWMPLPLPPAGNK